MFGYELVEGAIAVPEDALPPALDRHQGQLAIARTTPLFGGSFDCRHGVVILTTQETGDVQYVPAKPAANSRFLLQTPALDEASQQLVTQRHPLPLGGLQAKQLSHQSVETIGLALALTPAGVAATAGEFFSIIVFAIPHPLELLLCHAQQAP